MVHCVAFRHEEILGQIYATPLKNADFQSIFDRSSSAVTPSEKSSTITNRPNEP